MRWGKLKGYQNKKKTKLSGKRKSACIFQTTLAEIGYLNFNQNKSTTINKYLLKFWFWYVSKNAVLQKIIKTELLLSGKSLTGKSKECGFFVKIQKRNRAIIRSVLRAQLNILYGVYRKNIQRLETVNYYCKKFHLWWVLRNRPVLAAQQKKNKNFSCFCIFLWNRNLKIFLYSLKR